MQMEFDSRLKELVSSGETDWKKISSILGKSCKECRSRWLSICPPRRVLTKDEKQFIINEYKRTSKKSIASQLGIRVSEVDFVLRNERLKSLKIHTVPLVHSESATPNQFSDIDESSFDSFSSFAVPSLGVSHIISV